MMRFTTSLLSVSVAIAAVLALPTDISAGNGVAHHARDDGDRAARVQGFDIGFNPSVDWPAVAARGTSFAYILATDSSVNVAQPFQAHWTAARYVGLITGAYHVGRPYSSTGADQAAFFLANGGKWTKDGKTLPGALWIEFAPSRDSCYGMTPDQLVAWIKDFSNTYKYATKRRPVIKTNANFWSTCMGKTSAFSKTHDLWISSPGAGTGSPGILPGGWATTTWTFWQYKDLGTSSSGSPLGNLDTFNGSKNALKQYAVSGN